MKKRTSIHYSDEFAVNELLDHLLTHVDEKTLIVCVGTDKCIGDCLGPLVGTMLKEKKFPLRVFGTLDNPIHALNLNEKVTEIIKNYPDFKIIAIDACIGDEKNIGEIFIKEEPITPGKGVGKNLLSFGDITIAGIVDDANSLDSFTSRPIRLSFIIDMAKVIVDALSTFHF